MKVLILSFLFSSVAFSQPGIPGLPGGAGGLPSSTDITTMATSINNASTSINNASTSVNGLTTQIGTSTTQITTMGDNLNNTANRALDIYDDRMGDQIDSALDLGNDINDTVRRFTDPKALFLAGVAGAAGATLGGFLMNGLLTGVTELFKYITTDWDQVALDVYEANIRALNQSNQTLRRLEIAHARAARYHRIMSHPEMQMIRDMAPSMRADMLQVIARDSACHSGEFNQDTYDEIMGLSTYLARFSEPVTSLRREMCMFRASIESVRLSIQHKVALIQANFRRARRAMRENMFEAFDDQAEEREEYMRSHGMPLQHAKRELVDCLRTYHDPVNKSRNVVEEWNRLYCRKPEGMFCPNPQTYARRLSMHNRGQSQGNPAYNCIFECAPPKAEEIDYLVCPHNVSPPIPIIGFLIGAASGRDKDCVKRKELLERAVSGGRRARRRRDAVSAGGCHHHATVGFRNAERSIERQASGIKANRRRQKMETDMRINQLEHVLQSITTGVDGEVPGEERDLIIQHHQFLDDVCASRVGVNPVPTDHGE